MIRITLVVPVKDERDTIEECTQSILDQTYDDFEVVFVDGGSVDGTYEYLKRIEGREERVRVMHEPGLGPGYGKDLGFKRGDGELLAHIDGDNVMAEDYLEICAQRMQDLQIGGIRPGLEFEYENSVLGQTLKLRRKMLYGEEPFASDYPTIYRRSIYVKAGGLDPELIIGEDYDLWIRLQKAAEELKQSFTVEKKAIIRNIPKERSLIDIFRHSIWYGSGMPTLLSKHPIIGLKFMAEPLFYPVLIFSFLYNSVYPLPIFFIFQMIFIIRWGGFILNRLHRIDGIREGIIAIALIPLVRVVESLGGFLGLVKYVLNERREIPE